MTDLAHSLPAVHAARLRALSAVAEAAHAESAAAEARYTAALAELEGFAQTLTAEVRASKEADMVRRTVASELAVAVRESDRAVQGRMFDAHTLVTDYPSVFALWASGRIGRTHVGAVVRAGQHLPADARAEFDTVAAEICVTQSTVRARQTLDATAEQLHPRSLTERHRDARRGRRVDVMTLGDGMSRLTADLPTLIAEGIHDRLTQMTTAWVDERAAARARVRAAESAAAEAAADKPGHGDADDVVRAAGGVPVPATKGDVALAEDDRTAAEVRADTLADLLLTGAPDLDPTDHGDGHGEFGAIRAHVQVVMPRPPSPAPTRTPPTSPASDPSTPPPPANSPATPPGGIASSRTRSPGRCCPATGTPPPSTSEGGSAPGTGTAGSPAAGSPPSAAKWTTPSTGLTAARPA